MSEERFKRFLNIPSFEGHSLVYKGDCYSGIPWHTTHIFEIDGIKLEMTEYFSQAYISIDARDPEIGTVSITSSVQPKRKINRLVAPDTQLTYNELEMLWIDLDPALADLPKEIIITLQDIVNVVKAPYKSRFNAQKYFQKFATNTEDIIDDIVGYFPYYGEELLCDIAEYLAIKYGHTADWDCSLDSSSKTITIKIERWTIWTE